MPASHRNEKVKCEDCGSMYTRINAARPQKTFEKNGYKCPNCHFYTNSREDLNYHTAKKHDPPISKQSTVCFSCE